MPKIQIIHISTLPEQERCRKSKELLAPLTELFNTVYLTSEVYTGEINLEKYRWQANINNVKPSHYGCYLAHIEALSRIDSEYDYTLIFEEDAFLTVSLPEFIGYIYEAVKACEEDNIYYVSFGTERTLNRTRYNDLFDEAWHQDRSHCYLIPNKKKDWYLQKVKENPWDVADLWYNHIFCHDKQKRLLSKKVVSEQLDGLSLIDNIYRTYKNQPMYEDLKKIDDVKVNYDKLLNVVKKEIEEENIYETYFPIEDGDIVVDVGAHVGVFANKYKDKASKLYALEPDPLFLKDLQKIEGIHILPYAIGEVDGVSKVKSDGHANPIGEGDIEIRTCKFETFLKDNKIEKIDFLKLDCEGGEYAIFTKENIEWIAKNVRKVAGEFHIHTKEHRTLVPYIFMLFEKNGINPILTTVNGVIITKEHLIERLDYFREILFYWRTDVPIEMPEPVELEPIVNFNFVRGAFVELINFPKDKQFRVEFKNKDTNEVLYSTYLTTNNNARTYHQYYINWQITISHENEIIRTIDMDLDGAKVLIGLGSSSLGDTLAWFPYMEEFRKVHNCKVVACTHMNFLFKDTYPNIEFVAPGQGVPNLQAQYEVGWFHTEEGKIDYYKHPLNPRCQPMQKTASDILGLPFKEVKPILSLPTVKKKDTVTIGFHSTAQAKYWNNPKGWQDVVDYINSIGMTPLILSKERDGHMGNWYPEGALQLPPSDLSVVMKELCASKLFVGVGSGLSWLAWACNVPVILISGFSEPYTEMQPQEGYIRISTPEGRGISTGCFNKYKFNPSDWNWYEPAILKGTPRQFECSKSIESSTVIEAINKLLNK